MLKTIFAGVLATLSLASCGAVDAVKTTASNTTKGISQFSLSDLRPARIDVVEVREKDLKEMPLGKERALAFDQKRKRAFWSFLPGSFKEPSLPAVSEGDMDGSLLPPKPL